MVGSAMMGSLQLLRNHLKEKKKLNVLQRITMIDAGDRPVYDPNNFAQQLRTVAITPVSSKILENLGSWERLHTKHAYYRSSVRHESANSPHISAKSKTSSDPLIDFVDLNNPIGFICYNSDIQAAMVSVVEDNVKKGEAYDTIVFGSKIESIRLPSDQNVDGPLGSATVNGETLQFRLILGCEGRGSNLRDLIESPVIQHDYCQTAFVCTVNLVKPCDGNVTAFQNFFSDGKIIAMLPTSEETSNIVFTTTPSHAKILLDMTHEELIAELNLRLHSFAPADIPEIRNVFEADGKRVHGSFPLRLTCATKPYSARAICLGDAAHGIHPFAGQGLNLGIYDIAALTEAMENALSTGHDIGSAVVVGQKFAAEMLAHAFPILSGMEAIKTLCATTPKAASLGMKIFNKLPFLSPMFKDAVLYSATGSMFASRHKNSFLLKNHQAAAQ